MTTFLQLKYFIYIFFAIISIAMITKIKILENQVERWQQKAQETLKELSVCQASIETQNTAIKQFEANNDDMIKMHKKQVDNLTAQLVERKIEVVEVLKKDPSCEKQLEIILEDQRRFLING